MGGKGCHTYAALKRERGSPGRLLGLVGNLLALRAKLLLIAIGGVLCVGCDDRPRLTRADEQRISSEFLAAAHIAAPAGSLVATDSSGPHPAGLVNLRFNGKDVGVLNTGLRGLSAFFLRARLPVSWSIKPKTPTDFTRLAEEVFSEKLSNFAHRTTCRIDTADSAGPTDWIAGQSVADVEFLDSESSQSFGSVTILIETGQVVCGQCLPRTKQMRH